MAVSDDLLSPSVSSGETLRPASRLLNRSLTIKIKIFELKKWISIFKTETVASDKCQNIETGNKLLHLNAITPAL